MENLREYNPGETVIQFNSGAKYPHYLLSNFYWITSEDAVLGKTRGIHVDGLVYPSTEHAHQAQKYIESDQIRFSVDGDLGKVSGFYLVFNSDEVENKISYWMQKKQIGVIAKMATEKTRERNLGLTRKSDTTNEFDFWMDILRQKYGAIENKKIGKYLANTGDTYLLEFSRTAKYQSEKGSPPYWAGMVVENVLYGENRMGKYLMIVRNELFKQ